MFGEVRSLTLGTQAEATSPLGRFLRARRRARSGLARASGTVSALFGPRPATVTGRDGRRLTTVAEVLDALASQHPLEAEGAAPLAAAARAMRARLGTGQGVAACLTGPLILGCLEVLDQGVSAVALRDSLGQGLDRLVRGLDAFALPPGTQGLGPQVARWFPELSPPDRRVLARALEDDDGRLLLVPWDRGELEARELGGALGLLAPQGRFLLPPAGSRGGVHRVLVLGAPLRTEAEVVSLFEAHSRFERPLLLLADRLSPRASTRAANLAYGGRVDGQVLWIAPPETGVRWLDELARALGAEVFDSVEAALGAETSGLVEVPEVQYLGRYVAMGEGNPRRTVLLHGGGDPVRRRLDAARRAVALEAEGGAVPGAGATFLALARSPLDGPAAGPWRRALEAPIRALLANEGLDPASILERLGALPPGSGYDVLEGRFFTPGEVGPRSPRAVSRAALEVAAAAAHDFLTAGPWTLGRTS